MKKLLMLFIGVLLFLPNLVFADMGAPGIEPYEAIITNKNGAVIYDEDYKATKNTINNGAKVHIGFEVDGFAFVDDVGYIKLTDLSPVNKDYMVNTEDWSIQTTGLVLKKTDVRRGPAEGYEKIGELLPGETITVILNSGQSGPENAWVYVDNNKKVGFANSIEGSIAYSPATIKFMTIYNIKIGDQTIKAGTILSAKAYILDAWSRAYYIEYNGLKGKVSIYDIAYEDEEVEVTAKREINIYESLIDETIEEKDLKKIGTVKKGEVVKTKYYSFVNGLHIYYYEKGNVKGWIYDEDKGGEEDTPEELRGNALEFEDIEEPDDPTVTEPTAPTTTEPTEDPTVTEPTEDPKVLYPEPTLNKMPSSLYAYIMLGVAVCATAVVSIILINKKKKGN